jgi:hypothetical protein
MQISDILQNEKFRGADPDQQEEILNLYEQAMHDEAFKPGNFNMRQYAQAKQEVDAAKTALNLQPDPRSTFQRMKDEFVNGMSSSMQAAKALRAVNGLDTPEEAAAELAEQERELQARPIARSMLKYQKAGGSGWVAPILNIFSNPEAAALIAAQGLGSSVPGLAMGAVGNIGAKAAGGGKEAVLLSTMAGVGAGSAFVEGGSKILEDLREQAGDLQDTEAVAAILRDPSKLQEMKNRALARGVTVGAFDAASVALPSSMLFKTAKGLKGLAARGIGDAALQGMLGAAGEVAGSAAIGEESNPADAWAEFIGEMVPGMVELGLGGARTLIPQTEQAAQEKSKTNALFPSQTSAPTIQTDRQKSQFGKPGLSSGVVAKEAQKAANAPAPSLQPLKDRDVNDLLNGPDVVEDATLEEVGGPATTGAPEENMSKPKSEGAFTYHGSAFGPFASVADALAEQHGVKRGGWKVATNQQEEEFNSDFDTTANPDEADQKNIDSSDFVIVIGNDETLKNDVGQARSRNYALDQGKTIIEGRSADVLIPRVLEHIKANPDKANFTIIGPQDTAVRTTGKNREAINREATDTARELFQTLGSIPKDKASRELNTEANARRKASGMDYARPASPASIVAGAIPATRYTSRQESAQELLSAFDLNVDPAANDRVLVFGTDVQGNHDKVFGPIAQQLGAEKGKTGANGRTYALPIFDRNYKGPEGKNNRQGKGETFNPRSAKIEMQRFFDHAKANPGKEFMLMFGAYPHTFSGSQERAIFAGTKIPANVRFLSSTAHNIFPGATAPVSRVSVSRGKKSTRSASIPNLDRTLGEAQALDPNDSDKDLSLADRIHNKGKKALRGVILSERQARELLSAANAEKVERRREIVGTPKSGTVYNPAVAPGGITKLSSFPFTAFANSKKGTFLVRVNGVSEIGTEVDTQTAAELAQTNPQTIEAKNATGRQYLVDLDYFSPVSPEYRKTISKIYERETEVVTQAKASGQVTQIDADTLLASPQEAARPIGAQANLPGQVVVTVEPEPNTSELENNKAKLDNELKQLQAREAEEFGSLSKDGGRDAPKKKGLINTEERKRVSDRIRELTLAVGYLDNQIRAERLNWLDSGIAKITEALIRSDGGVVIRNSPEWVKASVRELNGVFNSLVNPVDGSLSVYGVREDYDTDPAISGLSTLENKVSRKINEPKTSNKNTGKWYGAAPTTEMIEAKKDQAESSYMSQVFKGGPQTSLPAEDLAKHIESVLFDNNPERMRTKSMPALKNLTPQQVTTLQDAMNAVNSVKPGTKPTPASQKLLREALNIVKEYAENEKIASEMYLAVRDENTYALNQPGTYMKMLAKAIARDPRAGSLANLNLFLPGVGSVSFTPDQVQTFAKGELTGSVSPVVAKFTPADTAGLTEEGSLEKEFKPNSLYLYDNKGQVLRVLPFSFRNRFIPNAGGVNIVPDTDVLHPTTSLKAFDTREMSAQKSLTAEELRDLSWAQSKGLLGEIPSTDWRGRFALDVSEKLSRGEPVVIADQDTIQFVRAYPGIFTGVVRHGDSIMVTEMKTAFGIVTSEAPVAGLSQDFTNVFYRLLQPFFALQENEFNKDIELGSKEENNFGVKKTFAQSPDDIVGGGVGSVGDTVPAFNAAGEAIPSVNKQLSEGERRFEEGLADESIPETETQKGAGEVSRGMGGAEYGKLLEPTEGAKEVKSARLNMLISPEKAELIRKADPEGKYVRMVVLPKISYIARTTGKEMPVTTKDGYAIVTGITDPRTGEYMGDKAPLPQRPAVEVTSEEESLQAANAVAAEQDKLGQYIFLPKGITIQDLTSTYQNILNTIKGSSGPVLVSRDVIEFNQQLQALQNVVSFDATDDGIYLTGVYDQAKGEWIGQLPYGARRMTTAEIASMTREQAIDLGNNINDWLREKRRAGVDVLSLDDTAFSDDEIKNRVLLLQTVAQSYLDGFGKTRESLEKGLASMMSLKTREKQNYLFLENVEARFQDAINQGAFDADELRLLPRLIEDAVNVFNSGVVYSPVDTNDTTKGWNAGVLRKFPNTSGRPREHFLSRVKKSGIPEQEANNLVDNLNINQTEAFKDSELMRRVIIEALLQSKQAEGAKLNAVFNKILSEYEDMREQFGDDYLSESRPTNTLYGFVTAMSVEGYGGVDGLARRVVGIASNMKINEQSFISLEGKTEEVKAGESVSSTFDAAFSPDEMGNDYDAQRGLASEAYDTELDKYETLPTKDKRRKKYEAFIQQMAKYRESLPFIQRAVHDIVMREGFGFTSGYRPSMYNGKSNAQLDILFPTVKLKEESQIGDAGKGKGFLSGKLLNSIFGALPGVPSSFIEPAVLSQIARERYEGILQELARNDMQEFSDAEKVRETLRQYEQEAVDEQSRASQLRKDIKQAGIPVSNKATPEVVAMNLAANPKRVGSLPKALLNILGNSPLASLRDASELLINRLRQQYKFAGTTLEQLMEQLIDPVGKFDGTLAPEDLISPENDRARMRDILFNVLLPAFENRGSFDLASTLNQMRAINDPYRRQANLSRVRKIEADVSGASKYATEEGFADAGVSFDSNLLNLQDPRQEQAMEYLRAAARRKGLKNVRFQANTVENYPVFTNRGSDNAMDPANSTIFVNPELLAEKLFQQKDINFLDPVARNTYDRLTEQLMDQLIAHEVAHLSYFEQLRQEYRARFPNGGVSWESYYNGRVREVASFLRSEDNGLKVKLPGQKAVSVTQALGELYPETKQSDEVLVAEFLRLLLELDKSRGAKVFTEGLELQRSLQVQDRVSSLIRGQSRQQVMAMDDFARSQRKSFLGWLRTVLDSVFNLFSTLKASSDPRARSLYETYNKISAIYDRYYSDYVAPPTVNTPTVETEGLLPMGEAFDRARPIGAQREEAAAARRPDIFENAGGVPTYTKKTSPEEIAYLKNIGAIDAVDSILRELDADKVAVWLSYNPLPDTTAAVEIGDQTFNLDNPQIFTLANYALTRFSETGQNHKATMLFKHVSKLGRGMGQTISIAYRLLKQFLMQSPSGMVSEYVSRLAETRGALKNKVSEQLSSLGEEVKQAQGEALSLTLNDAGVQALIKQINDLYGQALRQVNQDDLATIIRNHYAEFSGEELVSVLAKLLPEYENKPLLFELADMVQKNMQTQLGKALSLRGRTLRRNIVNRKGMNNAELRAERIEQLIGEMHEVVKPPISKSGNTIEDAISGDARKILELAALGAINDDVVLSTIESLGKFPSFDVNTAETLRKMMVDASRTPYGFQRDRKFHDALRLLHNSTKSGALPQVSAYWYMSMLSGPATFWMNFISTAIKAIADIATYSMAAATARGNPTLAIKYMTLGYKTFLASMHTIALAEAKGILLHGDINPRTNGKYVDEASINALESMGTDTLMKKVLSKGKYIFRIMSASDALFGRSAMEGFAAIQAQIQAIENVEGGVTDLSVEEETARLLNQTDSFVEQATKQAIGEKLTPGTADFTKRVYELRDLAIQADPERATIMRRAEDLSLYSTYNNKPYGLLGHIAEGIGALSREHPILVPLFVPFTKIVSNVTNESINYTPIGAYRAFKAWKEAGAKTTSGLAKTVEQMEQIKKIEQGSLYAIQAVIGTSAMVVLAGLAGMLKDDDDDGQDDGFTITGGGPSDPAARKQAREGGYSPYSFSFGGNSVKLSYLSTPLAIPLSIVGTWFDQSNYPRGREKDMTEKLTSAALAVAQVPFNQSFLQGLSNLFKMLDGTSEGQDVSALQNFFSGAVGNAVPNVLKQADQIFEPIPQQQTSFVGKWLFNKIPILKSMTGTPQLNVLGEVVNAPAGAERMLFLQRFINTSEADPLFKLLMAKNAFIPDARRGTKVGNYQLNDEQFYKFRELRGKMIAQVVRRPSFFAMAKRMSADQLDSYLQKLGQQASDVAKKQLTPELIKQGVKL